jgi:predicted dehydrogenase
MDQAVIEKQQGTEETKTRIPKLGFLGVDWIGKNRMQALRESKVATVVSLCDPYAENAAQFCKDNNLRNVLSYEALLEEDIDGVVIATPNALHKKQILQALSKGKAVFCQKPLGITTADTLEVISMAQQNNCLLMTDFSYRNTHGLQKIKTLIDANELGQVFAVHLTFHTAHLSDKPWYYDPQFSGGGCLTDLGVHLIDIMFWIFPSIEIPEIAGTLSKEGQPITDANQQIEDYAVCHLTANNGLVTQLSCSWNTHIGKDAIIEFNFFGTKGGATFRNVNGSYYDFKSEFYKGTRRQVLSLPPDEWGGKAAVQWAALLANKNEYRPEVEACLKTSKIMDRIYKR